MNAVSPGTTATAIQRLLDADAPPLIGRGLSKRYGTHVVLDDVDITLEPGQVLGLVGRNGAGKSTLIQCLLGLCVPDAGEARVWGEPALRLRDENRMRLAYVPQTPEAVGWMSPARMLAFYRRFYPSWDESIVQSLLARLGMRSHTLLENLSPGERQQVALARALASRPGLLVLDEPASALDPIARRELLREIAERAGESGCAVLFSTHSLSDLERIASHVALLHGGRLLLNDELDALKEGHVRLHIPADAAGDHSQRLPGEIARKRLPDGSLSVVVAHASDQSPPTAATLQGVRCDRLSLDDLFVEVAA